ncbi:MAG: hypothetical protein RMK74_06085 [Myxococcales bacterium]|nr:hypothetical protein [Myxococcales bacterium]
MSRARRLLAIGPWALAACANEVEPPRFLLEDLPPPAGDAVETARPWIAPAPDMLRVADPKLAGFAEEGWRLSFVAGLHTAEGRRCRVVVARGEAEIARLAAESSPTGCEATWNGRDAMDRYVQPGPVRVVGIVEGPTGVELARTSVDVELVRVGITEVQLEAVSGARLPLLYRAAGGVRQGFWEARTTLAPWRMGRDRSEAARATDLDLASGAPRPAPEPWEDLDSPPMDASSPDGVERDHYALPTAWVAGSRLRATARLAVPAASGPVMLRVVAPDGARVLGDPTARDGAAIGVELDASPVPAVGRYELDLRWRFEARLGDGSWQRLPGAVLTRMRLYGLVGAPVLGFTDVPHRAWVDVVDTVAGWVDGATAEPAAVAARIVEGVFWEMGLRYDRERGASHYTDYGSSWSVASFDLSWFQDRAYGDVVNCSDAASIVSTYASMVGVDFRYHILQHRWADGFDLNYIQAIGWPGFTERPFVTGRGGFRYHAVVGPPDGTFYDATLALDGDGRPEAPPHSLLLPTGLSPTVYLRALSSEWMNVVASVDAKVRLR